MLMAGNGIRFKNKGYTTPKALLNYKGKYIFEASLEMFPDCDKWIFAVNKEIYESDEFNNFLKNFNQCYEVILFDKTTNGQATTCRYCLEKLDDEDEFFVGSCDTILTKKIDRDKFLNFDTTVLTSIPTDLQLSNPVQYGWVVIEESKNYKIICKEELLPSKSSYEMILGFFYFSHKSDYQKAYKTLIRNEIMVNNEFYIDSLLQEQINDNLNLNTLSSGAIVLGTPEEYIEEIKKL